MSCPNCGSDNTQMMRVMYHKSVVGTFTFDPPKRKIIGKFALVVVLMGLGIGALALLIAGVGHSGGQDVFISLFFTVGIFICVFFLAVGVAAIIYNKRKYDRAYKDWDRSWYCSTCGTKFYVD